MPRPSPRPATRRRYVEFAVRGLSRTIPPAVRDRNANFSKMSKFLVVKHVGGTYYERLRLPGSPGRGRQDAVRTCERSRFRAVTLPVGRTTTRVAEFSRALPLGETARKRPVADFESDSVDATEVDRPAAPVDFPDFAGLADGLVLGCPVASPFNNAVRTCVVTLRAGRAATLVAEFSRALAFGESDRKPFDANFESDSVDATDVDRPAAPVDSLISLA